MTTASNQISKLTAHWTRETPGADRWQALQPHLARKTGSDASGWTRRSIVTCKWRAAPAGVSARV